MVNNRWARLSQNEKAELLGIYTSMGYNDLASIIAHYNSCGGKLKADGGPVTNTAQYKSDAYLYNPPVNVGAPIEVPLRYKPLPDYGDYVPQKTTGMLEDIPIELGLETLQRGYGVLMPDAPSAMPTLDARQDAARRIMAVENSKNNVNGGYDAKTGRWYPHKSHEGGADTIAYGIKLSNGTPEAALALKQGYLTDEQAESAVDSLVQKYYDAAQKVYDERYGAGEWDKLSDKSQSILVDYSYNPGLAKFPKLMEGFHSGNLDLIRKNYKRYSSGKELGRNKVLLEELDTLENEYPIFRKNGGKLFEMGGPGDWLKEKAVDLWYKKNIKPKVDELGIDEVRDRLYRNISPYSYVDAKWRIKDALDNKLPEFESFQKEHGEVIFPADRDDIFATYLNIPIEKRRWAGMNSDGTYTNNSPHRVIDSQYKPSFSKDKDAKYKTLTLRYADRAALMLMATQGAEDISDYSIEKGNITPVFANYDKYRDVYREPMNIGDTRVTGALRRYFGPHTISVGLDPYKGEYVSYYDKWDLAPFSGNGEDESRGLGTPIEFYDRIYYDDYYGVDSRPQNPDEFYGGYITPTIITAKRKADGGKIHIKPENRGKFTALKKRTGHSASWFKAHGTPAQKKMAVFALNSRKWKHENGGPLREFTNISDIFDPL